MERLKPFIKWAGGKEKELPIILNNLPSNFDRYIEPFVGCKSTRIGLKSRI